jgi:hypothetical protein
MWLSLWPLAMGLVEFSGGMSCDGCSCWGDVVCFGQCGSIPASTPVILIGREVVVAVRKVGKSGGGGRVAIGRRVVALVIIVGDCRLAPALVVKLLVPGLYGQIKARTLFTVIAASLIILSIFSTGGGIVRGGFSLAANCRFRGN